jgi:hypothetical protein
MLSESALARVRAGTVEAVVNAVANVPGVDAPVRQGRAVHSSGLAAFLVVGPKRIGIQRTRAHLADEAADRRMRERSRSIDSDVARELAGYRAPMALTELSDLESAVDRRRARLGKVRPGSRGKITAWTKASKHRMKLTLDALDWTPMFESGRVPALVTLTLPDRWEQLAPTPAQWRKYVQAFKQYYKNAWGEQIRGVWKLEFQKRGAPHLHILMTPPDGIAKSKHRYEFKYWLSYAWADIVNEPDPAEKLKHIAAGTNVRLVELEFRGPASIGGYFAKHGTFSAKDYQNEMPRLWRDAIAGSEPGIQFWGVWGLGKALAARELDVTVDRGAASIECIRDSLGVVAGIRHFIGEDVYYAERLPGWTDKTVTRFVQRELDALGSRSSDYDKVQRHLRKLARARWHRGHRDMLIRNEHGQLVLPGVIRDEFGQPLVNSACQVVRAPGAPRVIRRTIVDRETGELRTVKSHRIGTYNGTSGHILGLDGIAAARDVQRLLDTRGAWALYA